MEEGVAVCSNRGGRGRINNDDNSRLVEGEGGWWENSGPPVLLRRPQDP